MNSFGKAYLRLVIASFAVALVVAMLGYFPTLRLVGPDAIGAMATGIAVSLIAGCIGWIPIGLAVGTDRKNMPQAILMATSLRFLVVLALAAPLILSGWFDQKVLGLWIGLSYLIMLAVDTTYAVRVVGKAQGGHA